MYTAEAERLKRYRVHDGLIIARPRTLPAAPGLSDQHVQRKIFLQTRRARLALQGMGSCAARLRGGEFQFLNVTFAPHVQWLGQSCSPSRSGPTICAVITPCGLHCSIREKWRMVRYEGRAADVVMRPKARLPCHKNSTTFPRAS